jgi:hypothetical protein
MISAMGQTDDLGFKIMEKRRERFEDSLRTLHAAEKAEIHAGAPQRILAGMHL